MNFSGGLGDWFWFDRIEHHAELQGAPGEVVDHALAVTFLEMVSSLIGVFSVLGEHSVDDASKPRAFHGGPARSIETVQVKFVLGGINAEKYLGHGHLLASVESGSRLIDSIADPTRRQHMRKNLGWLAWCLGKSLLPVRSYGNNPARAN